MGKLQKADEISGKLYKAMLHMRDVMYGGDMHNTECYAIDDIEELINKLELVMGRKND